MPKADAKEPVSYALTSLSFLDNLSEDARREVLKYLVPAVTLFDFLKFPLEIRIMIYRLVLVNSELAKPSCISKESEYGSHLHYDLTPGLLSVCKQINTEATPVLYQKNTFVVAFGGKGPWASVQNASPLTRYNCLMNTTVSMIRNWEILYFDPCISKFASEDFKSFRHTICSEPPKSIEVLVVWSPEYTPSHTDMLEDLTPLRSLRNVETFNSRCL